MLLDPFEKQLDLPTASIQLGDGDRRQGNVVGQEHQPLAGHRVFEVDAARGYGEVLTRVKAGQHDSLIAHLPRAPVDRMRIPTLGLEIGFGARHNEAACLVQAMQPFEIDVAPVHDVRSPAWAATSRGRSDMQERGMLLRMSRACAA